MIIRTFGSFTYEEVQDTFGIKKQKHLPLLDEWLAAILAKTTRIVENLIDSASDDIFQIFAILQKSKEIIQRFI